MVCAVVVVMEILQNCVKLYETVADLAPGVRVTAELHVLPTDETMDAATKRNH